jgi:hypothetical protein
MKSSNDKNYHDNRENQQIYKQLSQKAPNVESSMKTGLLKRGKSMQIRLQKKHEKHQHTSHNLGEYNMCKTVTK